jgi:hypothetical protein
MSPGGSGLLTSAVGPTDISVDWSTLTSQRSMGPAGQSHHVTDKWDPHVRLGKRKRKGNGLRFMGRKSLGRLSGLTRPHLAQTCQLGLRLSRPAQAHRLARLSRPAQAPFSPPSLSDRAGLGGSAPRSLDKRRPLIGLPSDLLWRPDPVRLGFGGK